MRLNYKWAKGLDDQGKPIYASEEAIYLNGRLILGPKDTHYKKAGCIEVDGDRQPTKSAGRGKRWERTGKWLIHEPYDGEDKPYIYPEYKAVSSKTKAEDIPDISEPQ